MLVLVTLGIYAQTDTFEFVQLDDPDMVIDNPHVQRGLTGESIRWAFDYSSSGWRFERKHSFRERLAPSGGLVTSVEDLAKFLSAQMKPGVFSSEMLKQLHTESILPDGSTARRALGWSVSPNDYVGRILQENGLPGGSPATMAATQRWPANAC